jgi:stage II sporulation protein E
MKAERTIKAYSNTEDNLLRKVVTRVVHFILGILVCRGEIFGTLAPFGGSYVSAVGDKQLFWATLGTSIGYIILKPDDSFRYVAVTVSIALVRWMLKDIKSVSNSIIYTPIVAFAPIFASGIVMMFVSTSTLTDFSMVTVEAVVAGAVAFFMSRSLFLINTGRRISTFSQSEIASVVMSGCVLMLSLGSVEYENVSLGRILAVIIILICGRYGSITGGAIAGIATGSVFGMSDMGLAFICGGYGFGGLIGGLFAPTGKFGVAISFVICNTIMSLSASDSTLMLPLFVEALIGSVVFMVLPNEIERYITPLFLPKENSKSSESLRNSVVMRLDFASNALQNVTGCVNSVSSQLKKLYAPNVESIYENTVVDVCKSCGLRVFCWERQKNTTKEDFQRLSAPLKAQGFVTENDVENLFSKKCCRQPEVADSISRNYRDYLNGIEASQRVTQIRNVVAGQFSGLSDILRDMALEFENYKSYDPDTSARVIEYLHNCGFVPMDCGCMLDSKGRMSVEIQLAKGKVAVKKNLLAKELSRLCGRCFDTPLVTDVGTQKRIVLNEVPVFDIEVGVYQHIFNNGKLCGDCVKCFSNGFGQFVTLISDGMGTGGRAAVDSNMTVAVLSKLLKAGLSENCALQVANSALMVKSEDESLATVDLAKIDLFTGKVELCKAGAPLTYIKKNSHLIKKTATSLPIGILGGIKFAKESVKLSGGDVIVMVSDGAITKEDKWLEQLIRNYRDEKAQDLAKAVVNEAIKRRNDGHDDDITAVVVRLIDNSVTDC